MTSSWSVQGNDYFPASVESVVPQLENSVYKVNFNPQMGWWLTEFTPGGFKFDHKIYGMERGFIDHVKKSYAGSKGNMGVLLNGVKGAGKSVSAKILANELELPIILVEANMGKGLVDFLGGIAQDLCIFVDEYEKIFKGGYDGNGDREEDSTLLTLMDGVMKTKYRKAFLLTTNEIRINENMIQRPGRVRFLKEFGNLSREVIEEIVDDMLIARNFYDKTVNFISQLELITVDIVSSVVKEVNIHECDPEDFASIFNVKKLKRRHDVIWVGGGKDGDDVVLSYSQQMSDLPDDVQEGSYFRSHLHHYGNVTRLIDDDSVAIRPHQNIYKYLKDAVRNEDGKIEEITLRLKEVPAYNSAWTGKDYAF